MPHSTFKTATTHVRIIAVSGIGKLHMVNAADVLKAQANEAEVILVTSWIPSAMFLALLRFLGFRLIADRLQIRKKVADRMDKSFGFLIPELLYHTLKPILGAEKALFAGFLAFGMFARIALRNYIDHHTILYLRSGSGSGIIKFAKRNGARICVDHSIAHPDSFDKYLGSAKEYLEADTLSPNAPLWKLVLKDCENADALIVNSDFVRQTFVENGYDNSRIRIVYLGVPADFFQHSKYQTATSKKNAQGNSLLFVGHFDARKGADLLTKIMREFEKENKNIVLHIAGGVSVSGNTILRKLGKPNNIIFHEFLGMDDLKKLYQSCDIFVFPTYIEGSARAVSEAMAQKLPVITTEQAGSPIVDGNSGVLLKTYNSSDWASEIINLLGDPERKKVIVKNAYRKISEISGDNYGKNLLKVLTE